MINSIGRRCRREDVVGSDREKQAIDSVRSAFAFAVGGVSKTKAMED